MSEDQNRSWNDRYMLRLPDGMRDRIKRAAKFNRRSMNAEIVSALEKEFPDYLGDDEDFSAFYVEMILLYSKARAEEEKREAWSRLKEAVERRYPELTVKKSLLGMPNIVSRKTGKDVFFTGPDTTED